MAEVQGIDWFAEISKYVGIVAAAGGGGAAVVFGAFQTWGKGWLDSHFSSNLEKLRHEHSSIIEKLKLETNSSLYRRQAISNLHFSSIPELWNSIVYALDRTENYISKAPFSIELKIINSLTEDEFDAFLSETKIDKVNALLVKRSADKSKTLLPAIHGFLQQEAQSSTISAKYKILNSSLFLTDNTYADFNDFISLLFDAQKNHAETVANGGAEGASVTELKNNGRNRLNTLRSHLRGMINDDISAT